MGGGAIIPVKPLPLQFLMQTYENNKDKIL
jgi:hypothetical protein